MDKVFVISYLKTRNYWWQTGEVSPADKGIVRHEYLDEIREKKLFFCEEGLRRALTFDMEEGKSAENVVAWHLIKRGYRRKVFIPLWLFLLLL